MKKIYITLLAIFIIASLFVSYSFAMENTTIGQDMKNVMNDIGNTVQDAGQGIANGTKDVIDNGKNMMENMAGNVGNGIEDAGNTMSGAFTSNNGNGSNGNNSNTGYTATRTATTGEGNFLGMDSTMLTWVIMAIVGAAIIGLVWYYAKEHEIDYNE